MLAYDSAGQGVPLVFLHAFPLSRAMWKGELERFSALGRVIAPDLPGFGGSLRQREPSMAAMAQAVAELLHHLAAGEPVVLAGLSMGGYVAFEFIRQFPERVRALGLFSTRAPADSVQQRTQRLQLIEQIRRDGLQPLQATTIPRLLGRTTLAANPSLVEAVTALMRGNSPEGVADALLAMSQRRAFTETLSTIPYPTLVLAGEEDALIPPTEAAGMEQYIAGGSLQIIPRAGHLINLEQPAAFHTSVERFLREEVLAKKWPRDDANRRTSKARGLT